MTVTIYNDQERCRLLIFPKFADSNMKKYPELKSPTNKSLSRSETIKLLGHYRSLNSKKFLDKSKNQKFKNMFKELCELSEVLIKASGGKEKSLDIKSKHRLHGNKKLSKNIQKLGALRTPEYTRDGDYKMKKKFPFKNSI